MFMMSSQYCQANWEIRDRNRIQLSVSPAAGTAAPDQCSRSIGCGPYCDRPILRERQSIFHH
jgi:hypothetical protein